MNAFKITLAAAGVLGLAFPAHAGSSNYTGGPKGAPALEAMSLADPRVNSYASMDRLTSSVDYRLIRKGGIGARSF